MIKRQWGILVFSLILITGLLGVVVANSFISGEKAGVEAPANMTGSGPRVLGDVEKSDREAVNFTCYAGCEYEFAFPVKVDLSDGMNADEAEKVARCLYEVNMNQTNYEVKNVQSNSDGTWTVFLLWGSASPNGELENHSHYYNVYVNATDRTVEYDRCY